MLLRMQAAIPYALIEAATKEGPEAVAALLFGAGVELAQLPAELRRKLRGEAPAESAPTEAPKRGGKA